MSTLKFCFLFPGTWSALPIFVPGNISDSADHHRRIQGLARDLFSIAMDPQSLSGTNEEATPAPTPAPTAPTAPPPPCNEVTDDICMMVRIHDCKLLGPGDCQKSCDESANADNTCPPSGVRPDCEQFSSPDACVDKNTKRCWDFRDDEAGCTSYQIQDCRFCGDPPGHCDDVDKCLGFSPKP